MSDTRSDQDKYAKDPRHACKYGIKCYQKNPEHHKKYKHPPKANKEAKHANKRKQIDTKDKQVKNVIASGSDSDDYNIEDDSDSSLGTKVKVSNDISDSDDEDNVGQSKKKVKAVISNDVSDSDDSEVPTKGNESTDNKKRQVTNSDSCVGTKRKITNDISDSDEEDNADQSKKKLKTGISNDVSDSDDSETINENETTDNKKKQVTNSDTSSGTKPKVTNDISDSDDKGDIDESKKNVKPHISNNVLDSDDAKVTTKENKSTDDKKKQVNNNEKATSADLDPKAFIKEKFLVDMPDDFYQFWEFTKKLKPSKPLEALKDVGLTLVGPFDVLAGSFNNVKIPDEAYLLHWRYYRDPPEFQTVLKGDNVTGYHIGYFRDSPAELPTLLASNCAKNDGLLRQMGGNIFSAVNIYLEELKRSGDPFKKMRIGRIQAAVKKEAEVLKLDMSSRTDAMVAREKKIVTRTFNMIGLVVPYNRKTQVGYRELALGNKELTTLLTKLQNVLPEQQAKYLSELQPVFTYATIAADECDFGTGIELGWNIISHGVECLNATAQRFLTSNYSLLNREAFGKIAMAHMSNRKKGFDLSVIR